MKSPLFHLILWLCLCAAAFAGYAYWYSMVTDKSAMVTDLGNQIQTKTAASTRASAARTALADIQGDEALVESYFVPETGVVSFIDTLEGLAHAQKAAMKVLSVSTNGKAEESNLELLLTLSIEGSFDAVMRTVGAIEYAPYSISLSRLSLVNSGKNIWHATLEVAIGSTPAAGGTPPIQP